MAEKTTDDGKSLSLSAAILAPLNAIFEAQVHAARSFLSFILQMGFRHQYSDEEKENILKNESDDSEIKKRLLEEIDAQEKIKKLRTKKQSPEGLTDTEKAELDKLIYKYDDIRSQEFSYFDDDGEERVVTIPNLALIPVKPLAIDDAHVKFAMTVKSEYKDYSTIRRSTKAETNRPWFLITPKRIEGSIVPQGQTNSEAGIEIEINIKSTEMPYGLNRLLTTMTESSKTFEKPVEKDDE